MCKPLGYFQRFYFEMDWQWSYKLSKQPGHVLNKKLNSYNAEIITVIYPKSHTDNYDIFHNYDTFCNYNVYHENYSFL